jgi:hypothetical protein
MTTTPAISDPGELGPSATPAPAPAPRPSAPANPRASGHSPAIEQRTAAAARASGDAPPAADQQPPPAKADAPAPGASEPVKVGDMTVTQEELQEFFRTKGESELRKANLPPTPADYKIELPADFKAPEGVQVKFDETDPLLVDGRNWAHSQGFDQSQWSQMLALYGSAKAREAALINRAAAAELNKLGHNATMRVSAIENFLRGHLGDDLASHMRGMLVTEKIVRGVETLIHKFSSQGAASFSQAHRVAPDDPGKIAGYDKMTFEQRRYAQEQRANRGNLG